VPAADGSEIVPMETGAVEVVGLAAADVVVVELDEELPQAASPRPEAATATRVQVRRRVMWRFLSRRREDGSGGPVSRARR
jgi:hypothetical protein